LPDNSVAPCADRFYQKFSTERSNPVLKNWKDLLGELVDSHPRVIFVIDALDECSDDGQAANFLQFMSKFFESRQNVDLFCSSRHHILVDNFFKDGLLTVNAASDRGKDDMENFINGKIADRKSCHGQTSWSIFCKPCRDLLCRLTDHFGVIVKAGQEDLLQQLNNSLLQGAKGM
jgi:hypothetical protein